MTKRIVCLIATLAFGIKVGAQTSMCPSTAAGEVAVEHFVSTIFPYPQTLRIWLPPGYHDAANAERRYPVLYMFDGQNLFSGCATDASQQWRVDESLTRLIAEHKAAPVIVVGIDAPDDGPNRASELLPMADTIGPYKFVPLGEKLPQFMADEVMPRIEQAYRIQTGAASTAVGGASYGGVAALYLLMTMPGKIGLGLIESPSGSPGNGAIARWTKDWDVTPLRVAIGVGDVESHDFRAALITMGINPDANDRSFVRVTRAVAENLREAGGQDSQVRFVEDPAGTHTEASWALRFPNAVTFLFPAK